MSKRTAETLTSASTVAVREDDSMQGITVPHAEAPSTPRSLASAAVLAEAPNFEASEVQYMELRDAGKRLWEVTTAGKKLSDQILTRLQRSDMAGATSLQDSISNLPSFESALGASIWADAEQRVQLCCAKGVSTFLETFITCLCFQSFLQRGVLTAEVPGRWLVGAQDYDDELYLLGVIGAVREMERYAVNRGQDLDLRSVRVCLGVAESLEEVLMQFSFRNSDLRTRFDGVKYCVKRLQSLAYEIDLAHQRAAVTARTAKVPEVEGATAPAGIIPVIDLQFIAGIKMRYDLFDEGREQVMKQSRDVIKNAKNAIYALQRGDYKRADALLVSCAKDATDVHSRIISGYPRLRSGSFSNAMEEFVEALAYRAFRQDKRLLSMTQMQEAATIPFALSLPEYLGGVMDLTGEVGRLAIRSASHGRSARQDVEQCLACVDAVYNFVMAFTELPGGVAKKRNALKSTLTKIEVALYELALLSQGVVSMKVDGEDPNTAEVSSGKA